MGVKTVFAAASSCALVGIGGAGYYLTHGAAAGQAADGANEAVTQVPQQPPRRQRRKMWNVLESTLEQSRAVAKTVKEADAPTKAPEDPAPKPGDTPLVHDALRLATAADAHLHLDLAQSFFQAATAAAEKLLADPAAPGAPRLEAGKAMALFWLHHGHPAKAEAAAEAAVAACRGRGGDEGLRADLEELLGHARRDQHDWQGAATHYERARHMFSAAQPTLGTAATNLRLAALAGEEGWLEYRRANLAAAQAGLTAAVAQLSAAGAAAPARALAAGRLGAVLHDQGRVDPAMRQYFAALQEELEPVVQGGAATEETYEVLQDMALGQRGLGSDEAALETVEGVLTMQKKQKAVEEAENTEVKDLALVRSLARSLTFGAELLRGSGHPDKALKWAKQARELLLEAAGKAEDPDALEVLNVIGSAEAALGHGPEAYKAWEEAQRVAHAVGERGETLAAVQFNMGNQLLQEKRYEQAVGLFEKSLALEQELGASTPADSAATHFAIATALKHTTRTQEALRHAETAASAGAAAGAELARYKQLLTQLQKQASVVEA
eukprot:CAMPEP_0204317972 /NCGR_PEP_ID=MMETSP0469-20131031/6271_1 /ASSEMBLY_ACC=CAM_ASM_000384 /TAXON_ID=2969 /ORGANISM="Oxyrrhis marina" /LENGTH=553 /DNA_ID=CAMNT_0051298959 /DNA_START=83 /DNA_END=1744 /DNA_ORIENTATION=-